MAKATTEDKRYKEERAAQMKSRQEAMRVMDEAVPTPTQEEVDRAVMNISAGRGAPADDVSKKADADDDDADTKNRAASADTSTAGYKNRAAKTQ